ncbi:PLC-like phosphodiesterase, partial [Syncephalis plumigaleata]
ATRTCNGSSDYCSLPFDRYTFMGTHNSAAYDLNMNHQSGHDIAKQLSDGIRLFDIDTCVKNNQVFTCRGDANTRAIGPGLHLHLEQVRKFIDSNPNEVIVLNYDDYVNDPEITGNAIVTQLGKYLGGKMLERNDPNAPWPTLGQMISQGKQVVVF